MILTRNQTQTIELWNINIPEMAQEVLPNKEANDILANQTFPELARYYHAAMWSPTKATWIKSIRNRILNSWPGLTIHLIFKHLEKSISTLLGYLHQKESGV